MRLPRALTQWRLWATSCAPVSKDANVLRVRATCMSASCDVTAIDRASLFLRDWQLSLDQRPDEPLGVYTCGAASEVPPLARRQDVLHLTDGTTRVGLPSAGQFFTERQRSPQFITGELYNLNPDATIAKVLSAAAVTQREASSSTVSYPVDQRIEHLHDALCAPTRPSGWY